MYNLYKKPMVTRKLIRQLAEDLHAEYVGKDTGYDFDEVWDEMTQQEQLVWGFVASFAIGAVRTNDAAKKKLRKNKPSDFKFPEDLK